MNNKNDEKIKITISRDRAIELLFESNMTNSDELSFLDEYGNYIFPNDLSVDSPNTAIGTPLGFSLLQEINSNKI